MKAHRGTLILVLGILGLVICFPCGLAAWIMGNGDLKQMNTGQMDPEGRSLPQAGKVVGIIATVLAVLSLIAAVVFFMFFAAAGAMGMAQ